MTTWKIGEHIGFVSQQCEPRVMTGWGLVVDVDEIGDLLVQWPGDHLLTRVVFGPGGALAERSGSAGLSSIS